MKTLTRYTGEPIDKKRIRQLVDLHKMLAAIATYGTIESASIDTVRRWADGHAEVLDRIIGELSAQRSTNATMLLMNACDQAARELEDCARCSAPPGEDTLSSRLANLLRSAIEAATRNWKLDATGESPVKTKCGYCDRWAEIPAGQKRAKCRYCGRFVYRSKSTPAKGGVS